MIDALLAASPEARARVIASLSPKERAVLAARMEARLHTRSLLGYGHDPIGFVHDVLGETTWSRQREILSAVARYPRVAVPASHSVSKTHTAARIVAWWVSVHAPGTAQVITTAPTFRQVRNVLWPHVRRLRERHGLPGETNLTEWKIGEELAAFGFSAADNDEAAVQGFHAPNLLIVVDEAGGVGHVLGDALEGLTTGGNTRMLLIGNPPTDDEGSWFERACLDPHYETIVVPASASPNLSGEQVGECRACPPEVPPHSLATHLVDEEWVDQQVRRFGVDSAFVEARVHARFPRGVADKVIPWSWLESARERVGEPGQVRLGVDVAADGGDEFVIAKADGGQVTIIHRSSGEANASQVNVAGVVRRAVEEHAAGLVKIDAVGIGRGTADLLEAWQSEGLLGDCRVVPVNVSERASDPSRWRNQRAEMWWNGRELLREQSVGFDVDDDTVAQLAGPRYSTDSSGRIQVESKDSLKRRGLTSPDRGEAVLLALFEPPKVRVLPVSLGGGTQANPWGVA